VADATPSASTLGALLADAPGMVGAILGTQRGELRAVIGRVADGDGGAAIAAVLTRELAAIGALLGIGELAVASLKAPSASRLFACQGDAVLAIEVDAKRPLGLLETRLRTTAWVPADHELDPALSRAPTPEIKLPANGSTLPPPAAPPAMAPAVTVPRPGRRMTGGQRRSATAGSTRPAPSTTSTLIRAVASGAASTRPTVSPVPSAPASASQAIPAGGQVFAGDLQELCLPDLLEFLRNSHRTGLLVCTSPAGTGTIQLSRGMIFAADSPNALDLREHFMARGDLTAEQRRLLAALPVECFGETMIVDELASRDLVPRDEVERARVARIYSAFREMMGWTSGRFSFDPTVPAAGNSTPALSSHSILMQIYQEQDEHGR
jgi:hypothetical protein